ncbi:MAG: imidazolonepropionase [Deltaproteobacteria bacterium]|nr:MAG: imidazolonepropionase [Deltaproteobacteria bacterium]
MIADLLVTDISLLLTMEPSVEGARDPVLCGLEEAAVAMRDGRVTWVGPAAHAPDARVVIDGRGAVALPGLVDPHTHALWDGSRSDEFRQRLAGARYTDILEAGGGILSTVRHTRAASRSRLARTCAARLAGMAARGVTTVEVKSGYGLEPATERRMLEAAGDVVDGPRIVRSFLGAHAVPAEFRHRRDAYVRQVIEEQLPLCAPLADAVDVYCDRGAFTLDESVAILSAGRALGLRVRAHAEQVTHTGIAAAAAALGATCVDHLERIDDAGIAALAEHGTVAVLLPGAQLYLRDDPPPVSALRDAGVPMAVGTDLNPGSSPVHDLWACATLACLLQGLTVEEALLAITRHASAALGLDDRGFIAPGAVADLVLVDPPPGEPPAAAALVQHLGGTRIRAVIQGGAATFRARPPLAG